MYIYNLFWNRRLKTDQGIFSEGGGICCLGGCFDTFILILGNFPICEFKKFDKLN